MRSLTILIAAAAMALTSVHGGPVSAATPPDGGTISIEPKTANQDYDPSLRQFVDAAAQALAARGFTILDGSGHAAYVAELTLSRGEVGTGLAKVPADSKGASPSGASGGVGAGVTIPFSTGQSRLVPLERTWLELRIRRRGEVESVWHGTAVAVRSTGAANGSDGRVAADLTEAMLRTYPAEPEGVVGVP